MLRSFFHRRSPALLPVTVAALVCLGSATARADASCHTGWVVVPSPVVDVNNDNDLSSVAGRAANDIWAVGQFAPASDPNITRTLTFHFNGSNWSIVPSDNVGAQANALLRVAALANGHAWAVGYHIDDSTKWARSLIEFWDGTAWHAVDHPEPGESAQFFGVAATGPGDVWAVGTYQQPLGTLHTLIEHFDGSAWSIVASPNPGATGNQLYAVVAAGPNRALAVGTSDGASGPARPLAQFWNGQIWTNVPAPHDAEAYFSLYGLAARNDSLIAVGEAEDDVPAIGTTGLVLQGPGGLSHRASVSRAGAGDNHLYDVAIGPDGQAWAVGGQFDVASGNVQTLIEALAPGGSGGWQIVASPSPNPNDDNILGGVTVIDHDAWAVGVAPNANARQTLILHRCL
jgi:hypothetical protein